MVRFRAAGRRASIRSHAREGRVRTPACDRANRRRHKDAGGNLPTLVEAFFSLVGEAPEKKNRDIHWPRGVKRSGGLHTALHFALESARRSTSSGKPGKPVADDGAADSGSEPERRLRGIAAAG